MTLKATAEILMLGEKRRCNAKYEFNSTSVQSSELGCHHPLCPEIRSCLVRSIYLWLGSVAGFYFQSRRRSQIPSRSQPFLLLYGKVTVTPTSRVVPLSFMPFWIFGILSPRQKRTLNSFSHRPCLPFQVLDIGCSAVSRRGRSIKDTQRPFQGLWRFQSPGALLFHSLHVNAFVPPLLSP